MRHVSLFSLLALALVGCTGDTNKPDDSGDPADTGDTGDTGETFTHDGGAVGDETWDRGIHVVNGDIVVNGVLTVAPCAEIRMAPDTRFRVEDGGALRWIGEEDCPIVVSSGKTSPGAGDWAGIELYESGSNAANELRWVEIRHAGQGYGAVWIEGGASASVRDTTITASADYGLSLDVGAELRDFVGNAITGNGSAALRLDPGSVAMLGAGEYGDNGDEGIHVYGGAVTEEATWKAIGAPFVLLDGLQIASSTDSAHLTLEAGVELRLRSQGQITVGENGGLALLGTAEAPVRVTSASAAPSAGDWFGIEIYGESDSAANVFEHAAIEYGGGWDYGAVWVDTDASLAMTDSTVRDSGHFGVEVVQGGELRDFTGNTLTGNERGPVRIDAAEAHQLGEGAYGPNPAPAIEVVGGAVTGTVTWANHDVPYLLASGVHVDGSVGGAALTIAAGTTVQLGSDAGVLVGEGARLLLDGTADAHVTLTSADASPSAGDWAEIDLYDDGSVFRHADILYAGGAGYGAIWLATEAEVTLDSVTFTDVLDCDVSGDGGVVATDTTYAACGF